MIDPGMLKHWIAMKARMLVKIILPKILGIFTNGLFWESKVGI